MSANKTQKAKRVSRKRKSTPSQLPPINKKYYKALSKTLSEWSSAANDEVFEHLQKK